MEIEVSRQNAAGCGSRIESLADTGWTNVKDRRCRHLFQHSVAIPPLLCDTFEFLPMPSTRHEK